LEQADLAIIKFNQCRDIDNSCRLYNLSSSLSRQVKLPRIGKQINYVFIAFLAMDETEQINCRGIIDSALALTNSANADIAMVGISSRNQIFKQLNNYPKRSYHSCIESVTWPGQSYPPLSELAVGSGIVQPEIALL